MQRLGQAHLAGKAHLDTATTTGATRSRAGALQDAQLNTRRWDTKKAKEGQDGGAEAIDGHVACGVGGRGDDAGAGKADVHVGFGEGREEREREEEVGDAARAVGREGVLDHIVGGGARAGDGAGDEARVVCNGSSGVGDLHGGAICDGLEEAEEGDLVRAKTWCGGRGGADAGDVDGAAGEGREDEAMGKGLVACEAQEFGIWRRHCVGMCL